MERALADMDPRAELLGALLGERASANRIFQRVRTEDGVDLGFGPVEGSGFLTRVWLGDDQRTYLEHMALGIDAVRRWDVRAVLLVPELGPRRLVTMLVLPRLDPPRVEMAELEVERDFVRAVLLARREGADAAIRWVTAQPDPFGTTLRARVEEDGALFLWSVGVDGVDQNGDLAADEEQRRDRILRVTLPDTDR